MPRLKSVGIVIVDDTHGWEGRDREKTQSRMKGKQSFAAKVGVTLK